MKTVRDIAKALRVSESRVRRLAETGRLIGAQKLGRDWLIPDVLVIDPPIRHRMKGKVRKR